MVRRTLLLLATAALLSGFGPFRLMFGGQPESLELGVTRLQSQLVGFTLPAQRGDGVLGGGTSAHVGLHPLFTLEFGISGASGAMAGYVGGSIAALVLEKFSLAVDFGGGFGGNYDRQTLYYGGYAGVTLGGQVHDLVRIYGGARYQPLMDERDGLLHWVGGAAGVQLDFGSVWVSPEVALYTTPGFRVGGATSDPLWLIVGGTIGLRLER